jgi:hypothetical protein
MSLGGPARSRSGAATIIWLESLEAAVKCIAGYKAAVLAQMKGVRHHD